MADPKHLWIDSEPSLRAYAAGLDEQIRAGTLRACAVDTEADSLHHYQEKLCLIQLEAGGRFALIDPIAIHDIRPLLAVLDRLEVWFHGADYDLTMFRRTCGWAPSTVRDTQIAARLAGHRHFGLASLVEKHFGVTLSKASQKADWSRRPLPDKMLAYAVDDVRWLEPLAEALRKELAARNRLSWFEQSCDNLRADVLSRQERTREDPWRVSGSGSLKPKGLALLRALWRWRDGMAAARDAPPFRILNNQQMIAMASDFEAIGRVDIPARWRGSWRETFIDTLNSVRDSRPDSWPQRLRGRGRRATDAECARIDRLCRARDRIAESLGIETTLLGSRAAMEQLVLNGENPDTPAPMPWQLNLLAPALAELKRGVTCDPGPGAP